MDKTKETLKALEQLLTKIQTDVQRARLILGQINDGEYSDIDMGIEGEKLQRMASKLVTYDDEQTVKVIEGVYDGYFMMGSDEKKYPVPLNYASKTKLIPGDILKLRIMEDGKLVYKLISEAPRKFIKAILSKSEDNKYIAITDEGKSYFLNQAAATFFKGKAGDELSIIINSEGIGDYAAIEAIIPNE